MAAQAITAFLDSLEMEVIESFLDEQATKAKKMLEAEWPSPAHPENIYATGASAKQWKITKPKMGTRLITNEADYSGYTDAGFTRKGKATAKPWDKRGAKDYTEQVADVMAEKMATDIVVRITRGN